MNAIIVIPTIRDLSFLEDWRHEFQGHKIIVCEDHEEKQIALPHGFEIEHYSWKEINEELGDSAWIIPHFNASIRSFGYWKAWQQHPDMIVTIDDDCYPSELTSDTSQGFLEKHWANLQTSRTASWEMTAPFYTRGFPYEVRDSSRTVISHGLWSGIPDLDAPTQLVAPTLRLVNPPGVKTIPRGTYFPMSGMNLAFRPEVTPMLYFLLQGREWAYDRFDDIWAGVIAKKICDHLDLAICSGEPVVDHRRASNVYKNLQKEAAGIEANEVLWRAVDACTLEERSVQACYVELANKLPLQGDYWDRLRKAMVIWAGLFDEKTPRARHNGAHAVASSSPVAKV
jgi:reversibly glycosylated polypeptide/UDP-arabinopyranose mutase